MGRSYTGSRCLFVTLVSGCRRVPSPPASTTPFIPALRASPLPSASILAFQDLPEILNRFSQAVLQLHLRLPAEQRLGPSNVRTPYPWIINWKRLMLDRAARSGQLQDEPGNLHDGQLLGIPDIHRVTDALGLGLG